MKSIWKYTLVITDLQNVFVPTGSRFLSAQVQHGKLCLWAEVVLGSPDERREIEIIGTGHPYEAISREFIGTVQMNGGSLVWHIFERL